MNSPIYRILGLSLIAVGAHSALSAQSLVGEWNSISHWVALPTQSSYFNAYGLDREHLSAGASGVTINSTDLVTGQAGTTGTATYTLGTGEAQGYVFATAAGEYAVLWHNTAGDLMAWADADTYDSDLEASLSLYAKVPTNPSPAALAGNWHGYSFGLVINKESGWNYIHGLSYSELSARIRSNGTLDFTLSFSTDPDTDPGTFNNLPYTLGGDGSFSISALPLFHGFVNASHDVIVAYERDEDSFATFIDTYVFIKMPDSVSAGDIVGTWGLASLYLWEGNSPQNTFTDGDVERILIDFRSDGSFEAHTVFLGVNNAETGTAITGTWTVSNGMLQLYAAGDGESVNVQFRLNASKNFAVLFDYETSTDSNDFGLEYAIKLSGNGLPPATAYFRGSQPHGNAGLMRNPWFGYYWDGNFPWIYHSGHGWLYCGGVGGNDMWLYDLTLGWMWTSPDSYPWLWADGYNGSGDYLYYLRSEGGTRIFWSFSQGHEVSVAQ